MIRNGLLYQLAVTVLTGIKLALAVMVWILMACFAGSWILVVGPILVIGAIFHSGMTALSRGLRWRSG
jgi:hypothetical protein